MDLIYKETIIVISQNNNLNNVDCFYYIGMNKHFGYIGKKSLKLIIICLSPDFAKCRPYVICIRIKWLTERFYTAAFMDKIYPDTDTDNKNSPKVI